MKQKQRQIYIFSLAAYGKGLSGGDRIFIEFARQWSKKYPINIFLWQEGRQICKRQKLKSKNIKYRVSKMEPWRRFGFIVNYIARIVEGIKLGLTLKLTTNTHLPTTIIYSSSEFWMDSLPGFLIKIRYPNVIWAAAWYQTAPNPLRGYTEHSAKDKGQREKGYNLSAFLYWLAQLPIKPLISEYADFVLVNNEEEKKQFRKLSEKGKAVVVLGAVRLDKVKEWKSKKAEEKKIYDCVFQGRFHPQKGVVELIDIWRKVVDKKTGVRLAMIGDGPLMKSVKFKIKSEKLGKNIKLFGYVFDGPKKYSIFVKSKIVVHPAFYDSGGMASAEAMAFGIPAVGFNLIAYQSYYPKGMAKVKTGDLDAFAKSILELLADYQKRTKLGKEAEEMIESYWSWETRAEKTLNKIIQKSSVKQ